MAGFGDLRQIYVRRRRARDSEEARTEQRQRCRLGYRMWLRKDEIVHHHEIAARCLWRAKGRGAGRDADAKDLLTCIEEHASERKRLTRRRSRRREQRGQQLVVQSKKV